jgi:SAM-dependent methyltransferase
MPREIQFESFTTCFVCGSARLEDAAPEQRVVRCRDCGYTFANPRPTQEEIVAFYSRGDKYAHWVSNDRARRRMWDRRLRKLDRLGVRGKVLDVGAGIGEFLHHVGGRFSERTGTEVSREAVRLARERYGVELIEGNFESIPVQPRFDLVTVFHVLEHVPDPRATVEHCFRALRPGGWLVIAVPNDVSGKQKLQALLGRMGMSKYAERGPLALPSRAITLGEEQEEVHLSHFSAPVLRRLLERSGFERISTSLDPHHAESGVRGLKMDLKFALCSAIERATGANVYDTIWAQARRPLD